MAIGMLRGGWFPEQWDVPVALGLGVVITGYMGDTIAGWISQWVPTEWLNPTAELIIGIILFMAGGWIAGDLSQWLRLFSFGAFAVGIADAITILLGLGAPPAPGTAVSVRSSGTAVSTARARTPGSYR